MAIASPFTYFRLIVLTALTHSLHTAHSVILVVIIIAGLVTHFVPKVEVLIDVHGWGVAAVVLGAIIAVRLVLAPYWIWQENRRATERLQARIEELTRIEGLQARISEIIFDPNVECTPWSGQVR